MREHGRVRAVAPLVCVLTMGWLGQQAVEAADGVSLKAKDKELAGILELIAAQGGAKLAAHPEAAGETFTFAARHLSRTGVVRWLCRACGLAVVRGEGGEALVAKPSADEAELKQYKVASLLKSEEDGEALVRFISRVILAAFENREEGTNGARLPEAEALYRDERLKVLAPAVVHKEVLALLEAMAKAKEQGNVEPMAVTYGAYDLGFFRTSTGAKPPSPQGTVSLELDEVPAAEAAGELTTRSKASFYVDARDSKLAGTKVSLAVKDKPFAFAAKAVADALDAKLVPYDGAWLFVRAARRPLYEGLSVRVYYVGAGPGGRSLRQMMAWRGRGLDLPQGLPYAIEVVGDRLLASAPPATHERLKAMTEWRWPGDGRGDWGGGRRGRGGWGR